MHLMFYDSQAFNQSIGEWDVSNVTNMNGMFNSATSFNQNIKNWNISSVRNLEEFAPESALKDKNNPFK